MLVLFWIDSDINIEKSLGCYILLNHSDASHFWDIFGFWIIPAVIASKTAYGRELSLIFAMSAAAAEPWNVDSMKIDSCPVEPEGVADTAMQRNGRIWGQTKSKLEKDGTKRLPEGPCGNSQMDRRFWKRRTTCRSTECLKQCPKIVDGRRQPAETAGKRLCRN
jgi:hypothetical protein